LHFRNFSGETEEIAGVAIENRREPDFLAIVPIWAILPGFIARAINVCLRPRLAPLTQD
jgi:hypothetical protein